MLWTEVSLVPLGCQDLVLLQVVAVHQTLFAVQLLFVTKAFMRCSCNYLVLLSLSYIREFHSIL